MRIHGLAVLGGLGLGVWMGGCKEPLPPEQVKKVSECVELFRSSLDPVAAKATARALLEERALTEEAVESVHQCWEQLPPETANREMLVSEILAWVKEWDSEGRPKYLVQWFSYWLDQPEAFEGRQMAAAAFTDRLEELDKDDSAGLRAILSLISKSLGDRQACVLMQGRQIDGKPMDRKQLLALFSGPSEVSPWLASGLELAFEPRENCPGAVLVEFISAPGTGGTGPAKLKAKVKITRSDIILFDKEYLVDPAAKVLFSDFSIP